MIAPELVTPLAFWLCVQELVTPGQRRPVCTDAELATPLVFETMCARLTAAKSHTQRRGEGGTFRGPLVPCCVAPGGARAPAAHDGMLSAG